ncbi:methionine sulfoxide reductase A [Erythrobacter sp. SG61-1L]|uniref:peptide-methionine (S)-S-oxide reductase MsrA n=1 Tax=Erythrobacter sp. SG61-1L TaxID=1603897 RepID=UPI0006C91A7E|nr:peptide-methionine (S)-S-oxide reductase MsrA [Erythrobacter sp. SG61-1L]KPL69157.1 methionine sulfoxide reductase A [Erythrobacter sp. SG61-1L]
MTQTKPAKTLILAASLLFSAACAQPAFAEEAVLAPAAKVTSKESGLQTAIFAGGCFWGIEAVFSHTKGITSAVSGYHGGSKADAVYGTVSDGNTGHAESVKVTYDPKIVRYDQLLRIFFSVGADPTTLNYQGPDHGTQYRSALVPMNAEQAKVAKAYLAQMGKSGVWKAPIVTKIEAYKAFYPAEQYHQDFMKRNPNQGYIVRWDKPKVAALKKMFPVQYSATFKTG